LFFFRKIANEKRYLKVFFWIFVIAGSSIAGLIRIQYSPILDKEIYEILGFSFALTLSFLFQSRN